MKKLSVSQKIAFVICTTILMVLMVFILSRELWVSAGRIVSPVKTQKLFDPFAQDIAVQETSVANSPNEEARRIEEDRLQTLGRAATAVAIGRISMASKSAPTPLPTQYINQTLQALMPTNQSQWRIIDNPSVPLPSNAFLAENAWRQDVGDGYILVFAGYSPANANVGVLYVIIDRKNLLTSRSIIVPGNRGSLHIVNAIGTRLIVGAKNGDTLYFDVPGLRFVNSLNEVVPTATGLIPEITPFLMKTPVPSPYP